MTQHQQAEIFDRHLDAHELPDDCIGNEMRVFGPPGCGKTTYLAARIAAAAQRFGPRSVLVMSHTRAAAHELVSRDTPIPPENVATLHSICYRALGKPRIAETITGRWNDQYPNFRLCSRYNEEGEPTGKEYIGDQILREVNRLRARMVPLDRWPSTLQPFWRAWSQWKKAQDSRDFTDLIVECLKTVPVAPGHPSVIICDEFQDFSRLQMALVRTWAKTASYLLIAGDDDQAIYGYAGADPRAILSPALPPSQIRILSQSYRITAAMHRYVVRQWSSRISVRQPKAFEARDEEGVVRREHTGGFAVSDLASRLERHLAAGRSTMLLGSAHFALQRPMEELQRRGIPYGNKFRADQAAWNPLGTSRSGSGRKVEALISGREQQGRWSGQDFKAWADWLADYAWASPDARKEALKVDSDFHPDIHWLSSRLDADTWQDLLRHLDHSDDALATWWATRTAKVHTKEALYAARVIAKHGMPALLQRLQPKKDSPVLTVGTIHSVKGAQADVVYVLPDLTNRWHAALHSGGDAKDALLRLYYVACTRARETLVLCEPWRRNASIPLGAAV